MVSSSLGRDTVHLPAHMSPKRCDRPRHLQSMSTSMVIATVYAIVVMMDLIWQSLRRLFALCLVFVWRILCLYSLSLPAMLNVLILSALHIDGPFVSYFNLTN